MSKVQTKLPLYMSLLFVSTCLFPLKTNATDSEVIIVSSSTADMETESYNNNFVSSISDNELYKNNTNSKEVTLLNEELEINDLNNLIVNNSNESLYIYEKEDISSNKIGILKPDAIGEAKDMRKFDSEIDRFIAGDAEWLYIESGEISGYIPNESLLHSQDAVKELNNLYNTKAKITAYGKVYVRREPNIESDAITFLNSGNYVKVNIEEYKKDMEWIPVIVDDEYGYIHSDLITLVNSVDYAEKYVEVSRNRASGSRIVIPPTEETPSAVAEFACQFIGNPYVWGGTSLTNGADCSGFVMKVYEYFGINLPHSSYLDRTVGTAVEYDEIQPGDIVCYDGHVGIYAGNGQIINALNRRKGITLTDVNYDTVLAVRRVI